MSYARRHASCIATALFSAAGAWIRSWPSAKGLVLANFHLRELASGTISHDQLQPNTARRGDIVIQDDRLKRSRLASDENLASPLHTELRLAGREHAERACDMGGLPTPLHAEWSAGAACCAGIHNTVAGTATRRPAKIGARLLARRQSLEWPEYFHLHELTA